MLEFTVNNDAIEFEYVVRDEFEQWISQQHGLMKAWAARTGFKAKANTWFSAPNEDGTPGKVVVGLSSRKGSIASIGDLPRTLPPGRYQFDTPSRPELWKEALLGWGMGAYRYHKPTSKQATGNRPILHVPQSMDSVVEAIDAINFGRDLINTPAGDMMPDDFEHQFVEIGEKYSAKITITRGEDLKKAGFRTIYTVGQASASVPRLLDLQWGDPSHPKITLVGKGVCFDSGGLDLKSAPNMRTMKKDMGGAAIVLALARLILARRLPLRIRLLIPTVENAVSGNAYRPGDVIKSYSGKTIEVGNTDAEGRLILCDAITLAMEEKPDLLVDVSTLTGAARTAVGTEISALFATSDEVATELIEIGEEILDPIARLPLYQGYKHQLLSPVADICNIASQTPAGAITAALFLQSFVGMANWLHFDVMAWNVRQRPGQPIGGETMALRALYEYLERLGERSQSQNSN